VTLVRDKRNTHFFKTRVCLVQLRDVGMLFFAEAVAIQAHVIVNLDRFMNLFFVT